MTTINQMMLDHVRKAIKKLNKGGNQRNVLSYKDVTRYLPHGKRGKAVMKQARLPSR